MIRHVRLAFAAGLLLAGGIATAQNSEGVEPGQWVSTGRTWDEQRFSPLDQINVGNVEDLGLAWFVNLTTDRGQEATPLVLGRTLYNVEPWNIVTAYDAATGRQRWRYDPAMAGVSGQFADCGIHALHMASFIVGEQVEKVSADFASTIPSRQLEDDAMVNFRMDGGTVGRLWTSSVAIGRQHGFDIQVFGETGGMRWASEQPNQVYYTPVGGRTQIMEKGEAGLSDEAARLSRVAIAHPEGVPLAVANIYVVLAAAIRGETRDGLPTAEDGVRSMAAVHAAVASAGASGAWTDARPPMFR